MLAISIGRSATSPMTMQCGGSQRCLAHELTTACPGHEWTAQPTAPDVAQSSAAAIEHPSSSEDDDAGAVPDIQAGSAFAAIEGHLSLHSHHDVSRRKYLWETSSRSMRALDRCDGGPTDLLCCERLAVGENARRAPAAQQGTTSSETIELQVWYRNEEWRETLFRPHEVRDAWAKYHDICGAVLEIRAAERRIRAARLTSSPDWSTGSDSAMRLLRSLDEECTERAVALGVAVIVQYSQSYVLSSTVLESSVQRWQQWYLLQYTHPPPISSPAQRLAWAHNVGTADLDVPPGCAEHYPRGVRTATLPPPTRETERTFLDTTMVRAPLWRDDPEYARTRRQWYQQVTAATATSVTPHPEPASDGVFDTAHLSDAQKERAVADLRRGMSHWNEDRIPLPTVTQLDRHQHVTLPSDLGSKLIAEAFRIAALDDVVLPERSEDTSDRHAMLTGPPARDGDRSVRPWQHPAGRGITSLDDPVILRLIAHLPTPELHSIAYMATVASSARLLALSKRDTIWRTRCFERWRRFRHERAWTEALTERPHDAPTNIDREVNQWVYVRALFRESPLSRPDYRQPRCPRDHAPSPLDCVNTARLHYKAREQQMRTVLPVLLWPINVRYP